MKPPNPPIEDVLLDVRKAYRLLHSYQRMVLDAVLYVGRQLGLEGPWGTPLFSDPSPRAGRRVDDKWAWDWLNLVCYEFRFGNPNPVVRAKRMSIFLISDSGLLSPDQKFSGEPDGRAFTDASLCATQLVFVIWETGDSEPPSGGSMEELQKLLIWKDGTPSDKNGTNYALKTCSFSRLADQDATDRWIAELVLEAKAAGIGLEAKTNSIEQPPEVPN